MRSRCARGRDWDCGTNGWFVGGGRCALAMVALVCCSYVSSCGYHVAGSAAKLPSDWNSISIPAFKNDTTRYRIEQQLTQAVIREFITRTKYKIVQEKGSADGTLRGEVLSIETTPVLFNATTGQVTTMLVTVHAKVELVDSRNEKPLYHNDDMVFRDEYQISTDVQSFFEEQNPGLDRMSHDFASHLVADVLENF